MAVTTRLVDTEDTAESVRRRLEGQQLDLTGMAFRGALFATLAFTPPAQAGGYYWNSTYGRYFYYR
jgi:hypothetical protein